MKFKDIPEIYVYKNGQKILLYSYKLLFAKSGKKLSGDENINEQVLYETSEIIQHLLSTGVISKVPSINSFYRNYIPPGGSSQSAHMIGSAIDLGFNITEISKVKDYLLSVVQHTKLKGLGFYDTFIHFDIDTRTKPINGKFRFWDNSTFKKKVDFEEVNNEDGIIHNRNFPIIIIIIALFVWKLR